MFSINTEHFNQGRIQDFQIEGVQNIKNAKHEVPYVRGPAWGSA